MMVLVSTRAVLGRICAALFRTAGATLFLTLALGATADHSRAETAARFDSVLRSFDRDTPAQEALAADIRRGLHIDERVLSCFTGADGVVSFDEKWFAAVRVNLDGNNRADWVVRSAHPCLGGDETVRWWIFQSLPHGHRLILVMDAVQLDILQKKTAGFRILRTNRTTYRYVSDRAEYEAWGQ